MKLCLRALCFHANGSQLSISAVSAPGGHFALLAVQLALPLAPGGPLPGQLLSLL